MSNDLIRRCVLRSLPIVAALSLASPAAYAIDFQNDDGTFTGSWDTTITYGQAWRIESRDCRLIAIADGGCGRSPNIDDGDLNYDTDMYSRALKALTEISLNYRGVGAFVRASALYDDAAADTQRTELSRRSKDLVENYVRLLDAFAYAKFDLGSMPAELRLGRQAVSWGESTFIQNGINVINHFDVAALRVPGSELKEAFLPQEMVNFSLQFTDNLSAQAIYITDWNATVPEPAGSYFSNNDIAVTGGNKVVLGFGSFSDQGVDFRGLGGPYISNFQAVSRLPTVKPSDSGQYGFNLKYFAPDFNNGTEFGLFFLNYHSRLPLISGQTGTQRGVGNAFGALNAVGAAAQGLAAGLPINAAIATAAQLGVARSAAAGGNLDLATATGYATIGANTQLQRGDVTAQASNIATHEYALTAGYFTEYPEDIKLIGLSFNTQLQWGGIALQGEVAYRQDVPLQFDDVELLFAALTPFEQGLATLRGTPLPTTCPEGNPAASTLTHCGQLGGFGLDQKVQGWGLYDTYQVQFTATKTFANIFGASQFVIVGEAGLTHIQDMPDKLTGGPNGRGLRLNGPATNVSGNYELRGRHCPTLSAADCLALNLVEPQNRFADATSYGYRIAGRLEYPGLMGAWNVLPRFSWQHDVKGTTPGPGGNFVEGRYGLTLGVAANLRATWEVDMSWTKFGGAGRFNDINDRDYVAATLKFSF
ncbi:MAG TPA: DUF1302 domain-containing protein [Steroidobacteraceae bacterium]|jgi:hypothetical protein|nr:DUF1302 domain-containing protein [Steroidobacteraceae bacterium]